MTEGGVKLHADQKLHDSFVFFSEKLFVRTKGNWEPSPSTVMLDNLAH